jgi:hypothetical protein
MNDKRRTKMERRAEEENSKEKRIRNSNNIGNNSNKLRR